MENRAGRWVAEDRGAFEADVETVISGGRRMQGPAVFPLVERLSAETLLLLHRMRDGLPSLQEK